MKHEMKLLSEWDDSNVTSWINLLNKTKYFQLESLRNKDYLRQDLELET